MRDMIRYDAKNNFRVFFDDLPEPLTAAGLRGDEKTKRRPCDENFFTRAEKNGNVRNEFLLINKLVLKK